MCNSFAMSTTTNHSYDVVAGGTNLPKFNSSTTTKIAPACLPYPFTMNSIVLAFSESLSLNKQTSIILANVLATETSILDFNKQATLDIAGVAGSQSFSELNLSILGLKKV